MNARKPPVAKNWTITNSQNWNFNKIAMSYATSVYDKSLSIEAKNDRDTVRMHFGLRGDYSFKYKNINKSYDLIGGHHNIMYSDGINLEIRNKTSEIDTFGIEFPKDLFIHFAEGGDDLLKSFSEKIINGNNSIISESWGTMDSKIQGIIDEILINPYSGSLQNIFLFAKTLELLVLCVDNYKRQGESTAQYLKNKIDKAKIIAARDLINTRFSNPPNLSEIAREVGINEFKLKKGFKELFNSTVFGYMMDKRLNLANKMLEDTDKAISEISYEMGFSSPQHFSTTFKNRFGISPNTVRNNP